MQRAAFILGHPLFSPNLTQITDNNNVRIILGTSRISVIVYLEFHPDIKLTGSIVITKLSPK
jgi:hypothetical protein